MQIRATSFITCFDPKPHYSHDYNALEGPGTVNMVFLKSDGSDRHLLLNKRALIYSGDLPNGKDPTQTHNLYRLVFEGTDNDESLTRSDWFDFYASDLADRICIRLQTTR